MRRIPLALILLVSLSVSSCGILGNTPCNDIADVVHDASLFLCSIAKADTANRYGESLTLSRMDVINGMQQAISRIAVGPDRMEEKASLLYRLTNAKEQVKRSKTVGMRE